MKIDLSTDLSMSIRVCNLHFDKSCFRHTEASKLLPGAVPLEFKENGLKLLQSSKRLELQSTIKDSLKLESELIAELDDNRIPDFESFVKQLDLEFVKNLRKDWNIYEKSNGICFYRLKHDEIFSNVQISFKILVNREMRVMLFHADIEADPKEFDWILKDSKLESWTQLHRLLEHYRTEPMIIEKSNLFQVIRKALKSLQNVTKSAEVDKIIDPIVKLLEKALDQIEPSTIFGTVKLEPEEYTVECYAGQEFKDENSVDEMFIEHKLEVELKENEELMSENNNKRETSLNKNRIKTKIADDRSADFLGTSPAPKQREKVTKKEKKVKIDVLLDCPLCDRKQMSKDQLRYHGYSKHVRF